MSSVLVNIHIKIHNRMSKVEMEQNRREKAFETIRRARESVGECSSASSLLCVRILAQEGDIWREAGEYAEAARAYRAALSLCPANASSCPDHPDLLLSLGSTLHALGSLAAAAEVYELCQRYVYMCTVASTTPYFIRLW